jgi:hypothetical protein
VPINGEGSEVSAIGQTLTRPALKMGGRFSCAKSGVEQRFRHGRIVGLRALAEAGLAEALARRVDHAVERTIVRIPFPPAGRPPLADDPEAEVHDRFVRSSSVAHLWLAAALAR